MPIKTYKCFHPITRRKFVPRDVTFFEFIPFFSLGKTSFQGENLGEELFSSILLPVIGPSYHFESGGPYGKGGGGTRI